MNTLYDPLLFSIGGIRSGKASIPPPSSLYWQRVGTELSPINPGDSLKLGGTIGIGGDPVSTDPLHIYIQEGGTGTGIKITDITNTAYSKTGFDISAPYDTYMDIGGGPVNFQFRFGTVPRIGFGVAGVTVNPDQEHAADFSIFKQLTGTAFKYDAGLDELLLSAGKITIDAPADFSLLTKHPTGTADLAIATVKYVNDNSSGTSYWQRVGTELSPLNVNDDFAINGNSIFNKAYEDKDFEIRKLTAGVAFKYDAGLDEIQGDFILMGSNTILGKNVANRTSTAQGNIIMGEEAAFQIDTALDNVFIGRQSAGTIRHGTNNTFIGVKAGKSGGDRDENTAIGFQSGYSCQGNTSQFFGHRAGYSETEGDRLYIDNQYRGNEVEGRNSAMIYGEFNSDTTLQNLFLNANVIIKERFVTKSGVKEKLEGIDTSGNVADNMHYIVINTENSDVDLSFDDVDDADHDGQVWIVTARNNLTNKATLLATKGFYGAGLSGETEYQFNNQWDTIELIYSDIIQGFIIR